MNESFTCQSVTNPLTADKSWAEYPLDIETLFSGEDIYFFL